MIVLVVMGHVITFSFGVADSDINKLGMLRMPAFFYISGFFASKIITDIKALGKQLWKKTLGLLVPFFVFLGIWAIFKKKSFYVLFLAGGDGYWFLWVLWLLSLFFAAYGYLIRDVKSNWISIILWLIPYAAIIVLNKLFIPLSPQYGWVSLPLITNYYRYYLLGFLCRRYSFIDNFLFKNNWVGALGFICFLAKWLFYNLPCSLLSFAGTVGAIIVIQRFLMSLSGKQNKALSLFSFLGNNTLAIYVLHYFFLPDLSGYAHYMTSGSNLFVVHLSVALIVAIPVIAISLLFGRVIDSNSVLSLVMFGKKKN